MDKNNKKPNIIQRAITRFASTSIDNAVEKKMAEERDKAVASDVMRLQPRQFPFPEGSVKKPYPLGINFTILRDLADYYPIARACIEFRKSQITHLDFSVTPIELTDKAFNNKQNIENGKKVKEFFKHPTGKKDSSWSSFIKQILEDLLVIDAVAIYRRKNRRGDIVGYLPVDGATIELMLEKDGTTPEPPKEAYLQRIMGREIAKLTTDEMIYTMLSPRTNQVYGFAPMETLIITVTTALKLQSFNLGYLSEGNVPEGFITLPKEIASSRDQLKEWQDAWDSMLSGDPRFQRKLKFLPEGMEYKPSVTPAEMSFERFEKWLLQSCCAVYGVPATAIGFNFETNKATAQTSWEAGKERGLFPTALFVKELMDRIIQEDMGYEDLEFTWTNIDPTNKKEEADTVKILINSGLMSIDEWRIGEGLKPTGARDPFIMTPVGPIFVKDLAAQSDAGQMPILPYKPPAEANAASQNAGNALGVPNVPPQATQGDQNKIKPTNGKTPPKTQPKKVDEYFDELRRWKKASIKDFKLKRSPRDFKTDILDIRTQGLIRKGLADATIREEIEKVFEPFLNLQSKTISSLMSMYDELNTIQSQNPQSATAGTS